MWRLPMINSIQLRAGPSRWRSAAATTKSPTRLEHFCLVPLADKLKFPQARSCGGFARFPAFPRPGTEAAPELNVGPHEADTNHNGHRNPNARRLVLSPFQTRTSNRGAKFMNVAMGTQLKYLISLQLSSLRRPIL